MSLNPFDETLEAVEEEQQGPAAANPFEEVVRQQDTGRERGLRASMKVAEATTPDRAAEVARLSQGTGIAPAIVERNFDTIKARAAFENTPFQKIMAETPKLAEFISDPATLAIVQDDLEPLGALEWMLTAPGRSFARGMAQIDVAKLRSASLTRELTREEHDQLNAAQFYMKQGGALGAGDSWFRGAVTGASAQLPILFGATLGGLKRAPIGVGTGAAIGAAGGAAAGGVGAVPGAVAGATFGGTSAFAIGAGEFAFQLEAGLALDEYLEEKDELGQPIDANAAKAAAIAAGALNAGLEVVGLGILLKTIPGVSQLTAGLTRPAIKAALRSPTARAALAEAGALFAGTVAKETAVEVAQRAVTIIAGEAGKLTSGQEFKPLEPGEVVSDLGHEAMGALQSFALLSLPGPTMHVAIAQQRAAEAAKNVDFFKALGGAVKGSKTLERMPESLRAFVEQATKDGPIEKVFAPIDTFTTYWQEKGHDPAEIAAELTGDRTAYDNALRTGEDLVIPTAAYAVKIAGTEHNAYFANELRLSPEAMNARESAAFIDEQKAAAALAKTEAGPVEVSETAPIREALLQQLEGAGVERSTAAAYVDLHESTFANLGERAGVDPVKLFERYGLTVERPALAATLAKATTPAAVQQAMTVLVGEQVREGVSARGTAADVPDNPVAQRLEAERTAPAGPYEAYADVLDTFPALDVATMGPTDLAQAYVEGVYGAGAVGNAGLIDSIVSASAATATTKGDQKRAILGWVRGFEAKRREAEGKPALLDTNAPAAQTTEGTTNVDAQQGPNRVADRTGVPARHRYSASDPGTGKKAAERYDKHVEHVFGAVLANARDLDPNVNEQDLRAEFDFRLAFYNDQRTLAAESGHQPHAILRAIATYGGISTGENHERAAEIRELRDAGTAFGAIAGVRGVFLKPTKGGSANAKLAGHPIDVMLQTLQSDPEFVWIESVDMLLDQIDEAARHGADTISKTELPGTDELRDVGILGEKQWWAARPWRSQDLIEDVDESDVEGAEADTSFDVKEFSLFNEFAALEEPTGDTLATGEKQPRLPGDVGEVREQERAPGEFDLPFSLTAPTSKPEKKGAGQRTLFQREDLTAESVRAWASDLQATIGEDVRSFEVSLTQAGDLSLDSIIVARGAQRAGLGSKIIRELARFADANGLRIVLSPGQRDPLHGTTSRARLVTFYKRFGFVENKGRHKDFRISAGMLREPSVPSIAQAVDPTTTPAFKAWFGDSEVVDDDGKPLPVYVGMSRDQVEFKGSQRTEFFAGVGFFSKSRHTAELYAGTADSELSGETSYSVVSDGVVGQVFLSIQTPWRLDEFNASDWIHAAAQLELDDYAEASAFDREVAGWRYFVDKYEDDVGRELFYERLDERKLPEPSDLENMIRQTLWHGQGRTLEYAVGSLPTGRLVVLERSIAKVIADRHEYDGFIYPDGEHDETITYVPFRSSQVKSAISNRGTFDAGKPSILLQEEGEDQKPAPDRRGAIRFGPDRQFTISLLEKANLSTFLHESAHLFLEVFGDLADQLKAVDVTTLTPRQAQALTDYDALLKWLGVEHRGAIGVEQHEQFARGFEAYLMEGNAPSPELRVAFARFRAWLVGIYRSLKGLKVDLTDDVRRVMDRLVASDDAIARAEQEASVTPMFTTAEAAGVGPAEFELYRRTIADASNAARQGLDAQLIAEVQRETDATWKAQRAEIREAVAAETHALPVYQAIAAMQRGTNPDGSPLIEGLETPPLKLSRKLLVERFGADRLKRLPRPYIYSAEGGMGSEVVAGMYGFSSADEFLKAVEEAEPMKARIEREADRRMLAEHGSLLLDGTLQEKAEAAIANEHREEIIRAELRALFARRRDVAPFIKAGEQAVAAEKAERDYERRWFEAEAKLRIAIAEGRKQVEIDAQRAEASALKAKASGAVKRIKAAIPSTETLREAARGRIAGTRVRDLRADVFWHASHKAAQKAVDAAARQDIDGAITAKVQQLLNLALFRETTRVKADIDTRVQAAIDLARPEAQKRLGLAGDTYVEQVNAILTQYEFARQTGKAIDRRGALRQWVAAMKANGYEVKIPDDVIDDARRVHYKELTVEEVVGVTDALKQIVHLARLKNELLKSATGRAYSNLREWLIASIKEHNTASKVTLETRPEDERWSTVSNVFAAHLKIAMISRVMDGGQDNGPMFQTFIRPLNDARDSEFVKIEAAAVEMVKTYSDHYSRAEVSAFGDKMFIPAIGDSLSKEARLAVALNWGSATSQDRIINDHTRQWNRAQVQAILNTLDERDWRFVQAKWRTVGQFWEEIVAQEKRLSGVAPEKVAGVGIVTKFGPVQGAYYPLVYDTRRVARAKEIEIDARALGAASYAATDRGHIETRKHHTDLSVRLDLMAGQGHIEQVIHDLTHREVIADLSRLLRDRQISAAMYATRGQAIHQQFVLAVSAVAQGSAPLTGADKAFRFVRSRTTLAFLGLNVWTGLQQPLGVFNGAQRVGVKWVARGIAKWVKDAATMQGTVAWIWNVSPMMRERGQGVFNQDLSDLRKTIGIEGGWFDTMVRTATRGKIGRADVAKAYLWHIGRMQRIADVPTWLGGYLKALDSGVDEKTAIALADQAVTDSQGGANIKDLSDVQRGSEAAKAYMLFYSYGSTVLNSTYGATASKNLRSPAEVAQLLSDLSLLYIAPAMGTVALALAFGRKEYDDDDDLGDYVLDVGRESLSAMLNGLLLVREFAAWTREDGDVRGYQGPAGTRLINLLFKLKAQVAQGEADEAAFRALVETAGVLFGIPVTQIEKTIDGVAALDEGRTTNPGVLLVGAPKE